MNILIVGGGTAGHINPALAIADYINTKQPDTNIFFAGRRKGMEYNLVTKEGYPFYNIEVNGIQRKLTSKNIVRNIKALALLLSSPHVASKIIKETKPDIVIGTGGYVSWPIVNMAAKKGIKTYIHEQNAYPGITNKLLAKKATKIFVASKKAVDKIGFPEKSIVCGNPVKPEITLQDKKASREKLNINNDETLILSFGGSLGAEKINRTIADVIAWHTNNKDLKIKHIHATGSYGVDLFKDLSKEKEFYNNENIDIREYIEDMPLCLSAADLVISRAGAITLAELASLGKASILIPSPNVAENHQYHNAMELQETGAAIVFTEKELTEEKIISKIENLVKNKNLLEQMGENAKKCAVTNTLEIIYDTIFNG